MIETFISIALYFGATQVENQTFIDERVLVATEDSAGHYITDIPPSEEYTISQSNSVYVIEILGQDQNGAGK